VLVAVGYLPELYKDARSEKYKILSLSYISVPVRDKGTDVLLHLVYLLSLQVIVH